VIPGAPLASRAPLARGDEAWCLLVAVAGRRSRSGTRHSVRGTALVRVESIDGDLFHVVVVRCSSGGLPGERLAYVRATLYATKANAERRAFSAVLALLWGDR
jgi:hypothetical protein